MRSSFRWKLTGMFFVIILITLAITGTILSVSFEKYYLNNLKSNLIKESLLIAEIAEMRSPQTDETNFWQELCDAAAKNTGVRATIVDEGGRVLGDSMYDPGKMESHKTRPEIYQALQGKVGEDVRMSDTAKIPMFYVAVPFGEGDAGVKGAVRLSEPLGEVEANYRHILYIPLMAILITGIISLVIGIGAAERFSRPIKDITDAVKEMARGNLRKRISYQIDDELGVLASAVNDMAESLDQNMREISEVKNRLEALLSNTVNGILMVDTKGKVNYANPMALSLLSIDAALLGRKYVELIGNYEIVETIDKVKKECKLMRKEVILHTRDEKAIDVSVVPLLGEKEASCSGVLIVLNDITEIKRLERVRKDFVANVSHELKTPITTISGFAETLLSEGKECENIYEFSSIIYEEAQRLKKLIDKLLELSRLESGKVQLNIQTVDMVKIIETAIKTVKERSNLRDEFICFKKEKEEIYVDGDPDLIIQVLFNLLDNAVNYSSGDEAVEVILEDGEETVKVVVEDKGEGIPEKEKARIFERFYRIDKTRSRKTGGTGLGLSIVKHLVENHGGTVGVESSVGEGSKFWFTLPKKQDFRKNCFGK